MIPPLHPLRKKKKKVVCELRGRLQTHRERDALTPVVVVVVAVVWLPLAEQGTVP
jgi:hypothetical protein